jgi:hypothetical protein
MEAVWWILAYLAFGVMSCLVAPLPDDFKGSRVVVWLVTVLTWPLSWAFLVAMMFGAFRDRP